VEHPLLLAVIGGRVQVVHVHPSAKALVGVERVVLFNGPDRGPVPVA
jgi:hypothetical protein